MPVQIWFRWRPIGALLTALTLSGSAVHATAATAATVVPGQEEPQLNRILREATTPDSMPHQTRQVVRGVTYDASGLRAQHVSYPAIGTVLIHTPALNQHPELKDGCEVTALAMLLESLGLPGDKMRLAQEIRKDPTPVLYGTDNSIRFWGLFSSPTAPAPPPTHGDFDSD